MSKSRSQTDSLHSLLRPPGVSAEASRPHQRASARSCVFGARVRAGGAGPRLWPGPMALQALHSSGVAFRKILSHFPEELSLAFAYGSGVYRQAGPCSNQKNAMLDFVFTVDDPVMWHSKNLKKNWNHYSFLKVLGPKMISNVQNNYGAGVYYNPLITCDGRLIKYGVISTSILIEDLLNWNNLYIAGRLQKPVKIIALNENVALRSALDKNLKSAVTAAFLMLPESFSEEDLFLEIAGLSYSG
ncbi:Phosphatidate cytidylyltransferase; mitochondrial [Camelus dromedarius]|uniref:Phosphatidate cytidylyltransferase, mitochondrial n=1 Tax=Camelus dromedarius TaxID=9838 RepID=A0A5N4CYD1_CAMDR|nr:Phosphatidate cytidylyltransferase; mitochondrial [Camelus dromedarius]